MAHSRNPTDIEAKELFSYMDGPFFIFKSQPDKCSMGVPTMRPPAKKLIDIVFLLEELFDTKDQNASKTVDKILSIK